MVVVGLRIRILTGGHGYVMYGSDVGNASSSFLQDALEKLPKTISISEMYFDEINTSSLSVHGACHQILDLIRLVDDFT